MNSKHILATALALALPTLTLCAQDTPPPPPAPAAPPQNAGPRSDGGPRQGGPRPMGGLFSALDANHDGVIDAEEMNHAVDVLRKLDKNGDGKVGPEEFRGSGGDRPHGPEGRPDGQVRGRDGAGGGPRDGDRPGRPEGQVGDQRDRDRRATGPQAEGPRGDQQYGRGPGPQSRGPRDMDRGDRRDGPPSGPHRDGPPQGRPEQNRDSAGGPQAWQGPRHHHFHYQFRSDGPQNDPRFAQRDPQGPQQGGGRPEQQFRPGGPGNGPRFTQRGPQPGWGRPQPWEQRVPSFGRPMPDRWAMGPRPEDFGRWAPPQGQGEFNRDARGPAPQQGPRDFRAPQEGWNRFDGPRNGSQPGARQFGSAPGDYRRDEMQPRPHRHDFGPRPPEGQDMNRGPQRPPLPGQGAGPETQGFQPRDHQGPPPPPRGAGESRPAGPESGPEPV